MGPPERPLAGGDGCQWRLPQDAAGLQLGEDAPHHRGGDGPARAAERHRQLVLAPPGVLLPDVEHRYLSGAFGSIPLPLNLRAQHQVEG